MNEEQLKREIEEALSVEPSPQFVAHVRARIAESRRPAASWIRWGIAAAGFALVAVVVTVVHLEPKEMVIQEPATLAIKTPRKETEAPSMPEPQRPVSIGRAVQLAKPHAEEPEVLIDPREAAALARFVESVREDRIDFRKLIELQKAAATPAPIEEIALMPIDDLEPIVIESLTLGPRRIEGGSL